MVTVSPSISPLSNRSILMLPASVSIRFTIVLDRAVSTRGGGGNTGLLFNSGGVIFMESVFAITNGFLSTGFTAGFFTLFVTGFFVTGLGAVGGVSFLITGFCATAGVVFFTTGFGAAVDAAFLTTGFCVTV